MSCKPPSPVTPEENSLQEKSQQITWKMSWRYSIFVMLLFLMFYTLDLFDKTNEKSTPLRATRVSENFKYVLDFSALIYFLYRRWKNTWSSASRYLVLSQLVSRYRFFFSIFKNVTIFFTGGETCHHRKTGSFRARDFSGQSRFQIMKNEKFVWKIF